MPFLNNLMIRTRLLIGVLLPVLVTAGVIAWITASQIQANGEAEVKRQEALRNLRDQAGTAKAELRRLACACWVRH